MASAQVATVVGMYARISLDRRDGEGVARQLADGRELIAGRWPDARVVEYVDNDISAFRARRRPEFDRLLADLRSNAVNVVVAYHPDRLYRQLSDLEAFIDATQAAGADVATVKAGDIDMTSASSRMVARILGSVARHESERIGGCPTLRREVNMYAARELALGRDGESGIQAMAGRGQPGRPACW